jgi:hypothetical protein
MNKEKAGKVRCKGLLANSEMITKNGRTVSALKKLIFIELSGDIARMK